MLLLYYLVRTRGSYWLISASLWCLLRDSKQISTLLTISEQFSLVTKIIEQNVTNENVSLNTTKSCHSFIKLVGRVFISFYTQEFPTYYFLSMVFYFNSQKCVTKYYICTVNTRSTIKIYVLHFSLNNCSHLKPRSSSISFHEWTCNHSN